MLESEAKKKICPFITTPLATQGQIVGGNPSAGLFKVTCAGSDCACWIHEGTEAYNNGELHQVNVGECGLIRRFR